MVNTLAARCLALDEMMRLIRSGVLRISLFCCFRRKGPVPSFPSILSPRLL